MIESIKDNFIHQCPLVEGWCKYSNEIYYASLNYDESIKKQKPVFDLAYCATKAMNGIFLKQRVWSKRFQKIYNHNEPLV